MIENAPKVFEPVTYKVYVRIISSSAMNLLYERIGRSEGISRLLHHFYADVRQDPLIGPIFNAKIKDWKHHLEIITSFWETLIGGPRTYGRAMPMKHLPLDLREEHFERWLFLWQANCRAQLPSDVATEMSDLALHIAHKLRKILCISNESAITARIGPEPLPSSLPFNSPPVERIEDNN